MADRNEIPPQGQKPIDQTGFFTPIWHRFFLKLYKQANKTNDVEAIISTMPSATGGGSSSGLSVDDIQARLAFSKNTPDLTKRIEGIEAQLAGLSGAKDFSSRLDDIELVSLFSKTNTTVRVEKELWLNVAGLKSPGAKPATEIAHGLDTAWQFAKAIEINQESITGRVKVPFDMDRSIAPVGYVGWSSNGVSPGDCKWQIAYHWCALDEATTSGAQETLSGVSTASATSDGLIVAQIDGIDLPSATDACLSFEITRLSGDVEDTIAGTVELIGVSLNYTSNRAEVAT